MLLSGRIRCRFAFILQETFKICSSDLAQKTKLAREYALLGNYGLLSLLVYELMAGLTFCFLLLLPETSLAYYEGVRSQIQA